jgi:peptidoglycan/LPS O-acetylase OafA/YrhL
MSSIITPLSAERAMSSSRMEELDALRGLAAASVFLCHALQLPPEQTTNRFIWLIGDGVVAVGLFFVLSGFVLARSLMLRKSTYTEFVVKRCFRIYPAYWVGIALGGLLIWGHSPTGLSDLGNWPAHVWDHPVPLDQKFQYIGLIGRLDTSFISPIWSLNVEMRVSLIFPILLAIMTFPPPWVVLLLLSASICLGVLHSQTAENIPFFLLGIALATIEERFRAVQTSRMGAFAFLSLGVMLYGIQSIMGLQAGIFSRYTSGLGAALIILAVVAEPRYAAALRRWPLQFMGRISYSFYLVHLPITFFVASYLHRSFGLVASAVVAFLLTIIVAYLMFELIERPGMGLGSKAARLFAVRQIATSHGRV